MAHMVNANWNYISNYFNAVIIAKGYNKAENPFVLKAIERYVYTARPPRSTQQTAGGWMDGAQKLIKIIYCVR